MELLKSIAMLLVGRADRIKAEDRIGDLNYIPPLGFMLQMGTRATE